MANCLFGWENAVVSGAVQAGAEVAGLEASQLQNPHGAPARAWQTPAGAVTPAAGAWFRVDAGNDAATWRAFLLARTNLSPAALVRWRVGPAAALVEEPADLAADFMAENPATPPGWTWLRGGAGTGEATYFDEAGALRAAAAGAGRIAHDPATLERLGLLFEPARTNSVRNPRLEYASAPAFPTATGPANVAIGGFNGISATVVAQGALDGMPYVDVRFAGSPTVAATGNIWAETATGVVAANGQAWAWSYYLALVATAAGGASSHSSQLAELDAAGTTQLAAGTQAQPLPTAAHPRTQRASHVRTLSGGASVARLRPVVALNFAAGTHDVTVRFALPQLELGGFPTSPIMPAAGARTAATRPVDLAACAMPAGDDGTTGTVYVEQVVAAAPPAASTPGSVGVDDGTGGNLTRLRTVPSGGGGFYRDALMLNAGAGQADTGNAAGALGAVQRAALAWRANDLLCAVDGSAAGGADTSCAPPAATRFAVIAGDMVLHLRAVRLYGPRLTNGQVLALSASGSSMDAAAVAWDSGAVPAGVAPGFGQSALVPPAAAVGRYARCDISDPANGDGFINVPLAFAGPAWQPRRNFGHDTTDAPLVGADVATSRGGQEFVAFRFWRRSYGLSLPMVAGAERWPMLDAMLRQAAAGANVLFIPNPDSADVGREALFGRVSEPGTLAYSFRGTRYRGWQGQIAERL